MSYYLLYLYLLSPFNYYIISYKVSGRDFIAIVFEVLAQNLINSCSIVFIETWGYCKRRKEGRKLEYILRISNSVVVQGKMPVSCCSAAFSGRVATEKSKIGKFSPIIA